MREDTISGLGQFRSALSLADVEIIREVHDDDRLSTYFDLGNSQTSLDLVIADEFFSDLPATKQYQIDLQHWISWLQKRVGNHDAKSFITQDGRAFSLEIRWPFQRYPTEVSLHARLSSLLNDEVAGIYVAISDPDWEALRGQPFAKQKAVFVAARQALEADEIVFYPKSERPSQLQRAEYKPDQKSSKSNDQKIQMFIAHKTYALGFKLSDQETKVWVCDPWDAEYLGVDAGVLKRNAQLLRAAKFLEFDSRSEYATAQDQLILTMSQSAPEQERQIRKIGFAPEQ